MVLFRGSMTELGKKIKRDKAKTHRDNWHRIFAWLPVRVGSSSDGTRYTVAWLTIVERRARYCDVFSPLVYGAARMIGCSYCVANLAATTEKQCGWEYRTAHGEWS